MIYILVFFELFFAGLVIVGLLLGWSPAWLALWMGIMFVGLGGIIDLYRRNFLPDEMLMKVRLPKVVPRRELRK